jgi:hypothetical protein
MADKQQAIARSPFVKATMGASLLPLQCAFVGGETPSPRDREFSIE